MSSPHRAGEPPFRARQERAASRLREEGLFACVLEDFESLRSQAVRYLSGHPTDAILVVFASGRSVLVPWDVNLAATRAVVDRTVPYSEFNRSYKEAVTTLLRSGGMPAGARVELLSRTSHLRFEELQRELAEAELLLRSNGLDSALAGMRMVKDPTEVAAITRAAAITDEVMAIVEGELRSKPAGGIREIDVAQLVERESLARGAEGLGFETLAAGPARSWAIHPFPAYGAGPFGGTGLSILDFGVRVDGYTSDVTVTFARGPLADRQERMISLVQQAYDASVAALAPGASPKLPAQVAEEVFSRAGWRMPHSLGHGIGLDAHEGPGINPREDNSDPPLASGMVFTIEPGLYEPSLGGVRLENDALIDGTGARMITHARIVRL